MEPTPHRNTEVLIYTVRPGGTALWLPLELCRELGINVNDRLTPEIMEAKQIWGLLEKRAAKKKPTKKELQSAE